ncbi:MAG: ferredoxin [Methanosphaera sp. rholeuAM270]|nr:MAG: ferredoxin [Methanosphaera sp. rholeuAM270]
MAIIFDRNLCQGVATCPSNGVCIEICALNALYNDEGKPAVNEIACPECGLCITSCPNNAISKP